MSEHLSGCLVCGGELHYGAASVRKCELCAREQSTEAACREGHFVCDACHSGSANDWIERVCQTTRETDPLALATRLMHSPLMKMHGPEHHFLVPAVLIAACSNTTGERALLEQRLATARKRAEQVPGGFCGSHGNCGAGVGSGIFMSVMTSATPLAKREWGNANLLTARSLLRIAECGGPRCCKRDVYLALLEATKMAESVLGVQLPKSAPKCGFHPRNQNTCLREACPFHPSPTASAPPS